MRAAILIASLWLASTPTRLSAQPSATDPQPPARCAAADAGALRSAFEAERARAVRMLRADPEVDEPRRWRAGAVSLGEVIVAPILAEGCPAIVVEYTWTATDRRAPASRRWRQGLAVFAIVGGRARLFARRSTPSLGGDDPPHHGLSYETTPEHALVLTTGGAGWGSRSRYHLRGRRLVPMDPLGVGTIAR